MSVLYGSVGRTIGDQGRAFQKLGTCQQLSSRPRPGRQRSCPRLWPTGVAAATRIFNEVGQACRGRRASWTTLHLSLTIPPSTMAAWPSGLGRMLACRLTHIAATLNALLMGKTRQGWKYAEKRRNGPWTRAIFITICYMRGHFIIYAIDANEDSALLRHLNALHPIVEEHNLHIWLTIARIASELLQSRSGDRAASRSLL